MNVVALASLLFAQALPEHAGAPNVPGRSSASEVEAVGIVAYSAGERELRVEEFWEIANDGGGEIAASRVALPMPGGARMLRLSEASTGFVASEEGTTVRSTSSLASGARKKANFVYLQPLDGADAKVRRHIPFRVRTLRVLVEQHPGVHLSSSLPFREHVSDMQSQTYLVHTFENVPRDLDFEIVLSGLPTQTVWPRTVGLVAAFAIVLWMAFALGRRAVSPTTKADPSSAHARKERIVRAIEILNRDFGAEKMGPKKYRRRYDELVLLLADTLREIDARPREKEHRVASER